MRNFLNHGYLKTMETKKTNGRGGYRENSGRPKTGRNIPLNIRISPEAKAKLATLTSKPSEFIDNLIKQL